MNHASVIAMFHKYHYQRVVDIAKNVEISVGSTYCILTETVCMRKITDYAHEHFSNFWPQRRLKTLFNQYLLWPRTMWPLPNWKWHWHRYLFESIVNIQWKLHRGLGLNEIVNLMNNFHVMRTWEQSTYLLNTSCMGVCMYTFKI